MNVIAFDKICVAFLLRANVIFIHFSGLNVILQWKYEVFLWNNHRWSSSYGHAMEVFWQLHLFIRIFEWYITIPHFLILMTLLNAEEDQKKSFKETDFLN